MLIYSILPFSALPQAFLSLLALLVPFIRSSKSEKSRTTSGKTWTSDFFFAALIVSVIELIAIELQLSDGGTNLSQLVSKDDPFYNPDREVSTNLRGQVYVYSQR